MRSNVRYALKCPQNVQEIALTLCSPGGYHFFAVVSIYLLLACYLPSKGLIQVIDVGRRAKMTGKVHSVSLCHVM